jgi:probable rRNA maturation factor
MAKRPQRRQDRNCFRESPLAGLKVDLVGEFESRVGQSKIYSGNADSNLTRPKLRALVRRACREIASHPELRKRAAQKIGSIKSLQVAFLSGQEMRRLNREFRHRDCSTDILSFAPSEPESLGELAICGPVIRRQARRHRHSVRSELYYMLLHGVLHLLGYDHEQGPLEARRMFKIQDECWNEFETSPRLRLR